MMYTIEIRDPNGQVVYTKAFDPKIEEKTGRSVTIDGEIQNILEEVQDFLAQVAEEST